MPAEFVTDPEAMLVECGERLILTFQRWQYGLTTDTSRDFTVEDYRAFLKAMDAYRTAHESYKQMRGV